MTKKEYDSKIDGVIKKLSSYNVKTSTKLLDELFEYKPVSLKWYIAKAKVMLMSGENPETIIGFLENRGWYGYNYPDIEELSVLLEELWTKKGDELEARRNKFSPWICFGEPYQKYGGEIKKEYEILKRREIDFCKDTGSDEKAAALMDSFYVLGNATCYNMVSYLLKKRNTPFMCRNNFSERSNYRWLEEKVLSEKEEVFIVVITNEHDALDCDTMTVILSLLGNKVFLLDLPVECPVDINIDMADTLSVSLENICDNNGIVTIPPVSVVLNGKSVGDNRAEIIDHIIKEYTPSGLAVVMGSGELVDELRERPLLRKQMHRLDHWLTPGENKDMSFARAGSYLTYISEIFNFDVRAAIDAPAECEYSIVVPARNSASTLKYTLITCLDQRYKGNFEIVLSDNSTNGNSAVYDLYKELNDPRIKYYKTPCDLPLAKSFEFAFLHARGKFIFSIGSDDAVLPWGLEALDNVRKQVPNEEIIAWERGFYAWPGFNGGQQHQLSMGSGFRKNKINCVRFDPKDVLRALKQERNAMYYLPLLYINSGFNRSYFNTLLNATGCLWDGGNQDISIGAVNAFLYSGVLRVEYPITIAGMSGNSINSNSKPNRPTNYYSASAGSMMALRKAPFADATCTAFERYVPVLHSDLQSMYKYIFKVCSFGLTNVDEINTIISSSDLYTQLLNDVQIDDDYFDNKIHYIRYVMSKNAASLLDRFDRIFEELLQPKLFEKTIPSSNVKTYTEGFGEGGSLTLDASRFGVSDIHGAVELYEKILNL